MADHEVLVTLRIKSSTATNWTTRNPTLAQGEFGLETNTYLLKIGDGVRDWAHLPYLNKLNADYFQRANDGSLTLSNSFMETINNIIANAGGNAHIVINDDPTQPTDPVNLRYLQWAIAHAGHLKRAVVQELPTQDIDENTLYMVLAQSGDHYEEYMYIDGTWDMVGTTGDGGSGGGQYQLPIATYARLGGVKSAPLDEHGNIAVDDDYIVVNPNTGFMTLNQVSTSLLYVPDGDTLILYGGTA